MDRLTIAAVREKPAMAGKGVRLSGGRARDCGFDGAVRIAALDAMSEPSESPPKNLLSSLILIFVALIGVAGVALGVLWFFNNYIAKPGETVPTPPPQVTVAPEKRPTAPRQGGLIEQPAHQPPTANGTASTPPKPPGPTDTPPATPPKAPVQLLPPDKPMVLPTPPTRPENPGEVVLQDDLPPQPDEPIRTFVQDSEEMKALKDDADRRIDEAPDDLYPPRDKDRVRRALRLAQRVVRLGTFHFGPGGKALGAREQQRLRDALKKPEANSLVGDPEAACVVLGYADSTGDPEKNKEISKVRAMNTINLLKQIGLSQVTYPVAIGGTEVISPTNKDKNRAVEVWFVLP